MERVYFKTGSLSILHADFLTSSLIQKNSIDLLITSPPYNVDISYSSTLDNIPYEEYLQFTASWLQKARTLMKSDGRMCLNVPLDKNRGGQQSVYADIVHLARESGWKYHSTIIWNEGTISRRTAWGSFQSASAPYVITPVETVAVLYRDSWKKDRKGASDISRDDFISWTNGLWTFSGESKKRIGHPSPYPLELPLRCIRLFSYIGDIILDPFLGSGTTLIACQRLNRKGVGVDIDKKYCQMAKERLRKEIQKG
ncbi:MAG: site-specific DNA-methyltransferase [Methanomicrobiales archaeon]|nr:site-specific DNA-methyltransferase [Methanomicrobiales archaeon]